MLETEGERSKEATSQEEERRRAWAGKADSFYDQFYR